MKILVLGSGSFGCALAEHLNRLNYEIVIYSRSDKFMYERKLPKALGKRNVSDNILIFNDVKKVMNNVDIILFTLPSVAMREVCQLIKPYYNGQVCVIATKGIEPITFNTMDKIVSEELCDDNIAVLSGPTHAEEVINELPTSCVIASNNIETATYLQNIFMSDSFRVYTSVDVIGVELGGAIKNIIALAAGISDGLGYGDNAKAALITRGIVEISRLGEALGANPKTLTGLAGIGDLIVTCSSIHSRNRLCGYYIGQGMSFEEAIKKVGMVVEGINALEPTYKMARASKVDIPIIQTIYDVVQGNIKVEDAAKVLINREPKIED